MLRVFVYGTLKFGEGHANCDLFCHGVTSAEAACVRGRVVDRPEGCPTLFVPPGDVLVRGGAAYDQDAALAHAAYSLPDPTAFTTPPPPFGLVRGQLLHFDDPVERLPNLDWLEDFYPGEPSLYVRVLLPCLCGGRVLACWGYISPHSARFALEARPTPAGEPPTA